jgi:hypothetical protein
MPDPSDFSRRGTLRASVTAAGIAALGLSDLEPAETRPATPGRPGQQLSDGSLEATAPRDTFRSRP